MIEVNYKPRFARKFDSLNRDLQVEVLEKIDLFKDYSNHTSLKVHKLHGQLKDQYSFSVNYKFRIVFQYVSKNEVELLTVGDHDVYN